MLFGCAALLVSSGSVIVAPYYFGKVIDAAVNDHGDKHLLGREVIILGIIYIVGSVASFLRAWLFTLAGQRLVAGLRTDVFRAIIRQDIAFFDNNRTGELTNRLASDTAVIQSCEMRCAEFLLPDRILTAFHSIFPQPSPSTSPCCCAPWCRLLARWRSCSGCHGS